MSVPSSIRIGTGVTICKPSDGGVRLIRFEAFEKKANTFFARQQSRLRFREDVRTLVVGLHRLDWDSLQGGGGTRPRSIALAFTVPGRQAISPFLGIYAN
jgi:hypothetical protein